MEQLVFASNNQHKFDEVVALLPEMHIIRLDESGYTGDLPETSETIRGNAIQKAEFLFSKTGRNCFSDDTGLEVDALGGLPGVDTAHYAGPECNAVQNMQKLLYMLDGKPNRKARFVTVIALVWQGRTYTFEGEVWGHIAETMSGNGGFGYDPVFIPDGYNQTFASLPHSVKQAVSHRAEALKKLIAWIKSDVAPAGIEPASRV